MSKKKSKAKQPPKEEQPQPPSLHGGDAHQTAFLDERSSKGAVHGGDTHHTGLSDVPPLSSVHGGDVLSTRLVDDPLRSSVHGGDALLTGGSSAGHITQAPAEVLFGRYELLDKLGHGGMAEVWRVYDRKTKQSVALKRISGHLQANEEAQRRFFREIQLLQELKHPHIIAIYEASPEGFFFTMELLAGRDLRQYLLERKRLPLHLALDIFGQVGRALLAAHQSGIVHRDLKPENIFLLDKPPLFVKLLDFGIAVALEGTRMTMTQQMQLGTAYYMAPEQLHGDTHAIGPAADVYSCGVLLYEIVTGRIPQIGAPTISKHLEKLEDKGLLGREEIPSELRDAFFSHLAEIEKAYQQALPSEPEDRCSLQELTSSVDARFLAWKRQREQAASQRISVIQQSVEKGQETEVFASLLPDLVAVFSEQEVVESFAESLVEARKERDLLVASLLVEEVEGTPFWEERAALWQSALERSAYGALYRHHAFVATLREKQRHFDAARLESCALAETKGPIMASAAWAKTAHHFQAAQAWQATLAEESTRQKRCEEATEALLQTLKEPWPLEALQKNLAMWDEAANHSAVARYFKESSRVEKSQSIGFVVSLLRLYDERLVEVEQKQQKKELPRYVEAVERFVKQFESDKRREHQEESRFLLHTLEQLRDATETTLSEKPPVLLSRLEALLQRWVVFAEHNAFAAQIVEKHESYCALKQALAEEQEVRQLLHKGDLDTFLWRLQRAKGLTWPTKLAELRASVEASQQAVSRLRDETQAFSQKQDLGWEEAEVLKQRWDALAEQAHLNARMVQRDAAYQELCEILTHASKSLQRLEKAIAAGQFEEAEAALGELARYASPRVEPYRVAFAAFREVYRELERLLESNAPDARLVAEQRWKDFLSSADFSALFAVSPANEIFSLDRKRKLCQKMLKNLEICEISPDGAVDEWEDFQKEAQFSSEEEDIWKAHALNLFAIREAQPKSIFSEPQRFWIGLGHSIRYFLGKAKHKPLLYHNTMFGLAVFLAVSFHSVLGDLLHHTALWSPSWGGLLGVVGWLFLRIRDTANFGERIAMVRRAYQEIHRLPAQPMMFFGENGDFMPITDVQRRYLHESVRDSASSFERIRNVPNDAFVWRYLALCLLFLFVCVGQVRWRYCLSGEAYCGGRCILVSTVENCGKCGNRCADAQSCMDRVCRCPEQQALCDGKCVGLDTIRNCGKCGNRCADTQSCVDGACRDAVMEKTFVLLGQKFAMRLIPAGSFLMGSSLNEVGRDSDEGPQRTVQISKGFWMLETEVTQGQYEVIMASNPSRFNDANRPVENVSWYDAAAFANKLSALNGLPACFVGSGEQMRGIRGYVRCKGWRLPTEAEWEYAARAWNPAPRYGDLDKIAWYDGNIEAGTFTVGQKQANAWGLHDMLGNVWEWCYDWYKRGYPTQAATDPVGAATGTRRVRRGGSWSNHANFVRAAQRFDYTPTFRSSHLGFRVVRSEPLVAVYRFTVLPFAARWIGGERGWSLRERMCFPSTVQWYAQYRARRVLMGVALQDARQRARPRRVVKCRARLEERGASKGGRVRVGVRGFVGVVWRVVDEKAVDKGWVWCVFFGVFLCMSGYLHYTRKERCVWKKRCCMHN